MLVLFSVSSDYSLVSIKGHTKLNTSSDDPFDSTIYRYTKADRDIFRSFLVRAPLLAFFKNRVSRRTLTSFPSGFFQAWKFHFKRSPKSQPCFMSERAAIIAQCNRYYQKDSFNRTLTAFKTAHYAREPWKMLKATMGKQSKPMLKTKNWLPLILEHYEYDTQQNA